MNNQESIVLRSSVLPGLMKQTLLKGTLKGGIGVALLVFGAIFLPSQEMKNWGIVFFIIAFTLLTWGLLPYKRLKRLEENPNSLILEDDFWIHFAVKGSKVFSVPVNSIERIDYFPYGLSLESDKQKASEECAKNGKYGIALWLKTNGFSDIQKAPHFNLERFHRISRQNYGCDLFFAYFSPRSYQTLKLGMGSV
jgi:hypothetical protein